MANWRGIAELMAQRYGLPPSLIIRQIMQESGGNPRATSSAGAQGIAQFMPATARGMHVNPWDVRSSIEGMARMDSQNYKQYHNFKDVLSLYNSGKGWATGQGIGETRNYVNSILSGMQGGMTSGTTSPPPTPQNPLQGGISGTGGAGDFQKMLATQLLNASSHGGQMDAGSLLGLALARQQSQSAAPQAAPLAPTAPTGATGGKGINELFYDPLGGIKNGQQIGAIGHHNDHVHVALKTLAAQLAAEQRARAMGMHVGEEQNSDFHNVHAQNSYHNRNFPGTHWREAADISGNPSQMAAYYRWVASHF